MKNKVDIVGDEIGLTDAIARIGTGISSSLTTVNASIVISNLSLTNINSNIVVTNNTLTAGNLSLLSILSSANASIVGLNSLLSASNSTLAQLQDVLICAGVSLDDFSTETTLSGMNTNLVSLLNKLTTEVDDMIIPTGATYHVVINLNYALSGTTWIPVQAI